MITDEEGAKIVFELVQDDDGYPPDRWERLWAIRVQGGELYRIDNIPFYVKGISNGDVVAVNSVEGELVFSKLITPSLNSVIRLYVMEVSDVSTARKEFLDLGCESELSNVQKLFALEVPEKVAFGPVASLIRAGVDQGRWEYEVGVLRHGGSGALVA